MAATKTKRGGARPGAGRKKGSGKWGEPTQAIRIPQSKVADVAALLDGEGVAYELPLYASKVQAGFPSPADDYMEGMIDLNAHLIKHPAATFFVRVAGESMLGAGIHEDDILVVDRSLTPVHDKIVIAVVDGELTVKRLYKKAGEVKLIPENPDFTPIDITPETDFSIWGVVTNVIHPV